MTVLWTRGAAGDVAGLDDAIRLAALERVGLLSDFPLMGPAMDGPFAGYRQLLVGRCRVIYRVIGDDVHIAYVRHGARQLGLRVVRRDPDDEP